MAHRPPVQNDTGQQTARGLEMTIGAAGPRPQQSLPTPPAASRVPSEELARLPSPDDVFLPPGASPQTSSVIGSFHRRG